MNQPRISAQSVFGKMAKSIRNRNRDEYFELFDENLEFWLVTPGP